MKKIILAGLTAFSAITALSAMTAAASEIEMVSCMKQKEAPLILFLSRTGNTAAVGEMIKQFTGGDTEALSLVEPYPENYQQTVEQVREENESGFLPELVSLKNDPERYSEIFIGFPTWGMALPPPVKALLRSTELRDKTVFPFNTNAGYGLGSSIKTFRELCVGCNVMFEFSAKGGIERDGILLAIKGKREVEVRGEVKAWLETEYCAVDKTVN
ncbi:hypothetical protein BFC18_20280 [Alteromonas confluentis]|uniref:Flavodoxin-like domain-containing protein n=2 Tax=Alteromonas confluentis TaxID=1656094 RepID=A0A1E7Z6B6_9ALTE|nr:hypothetical protein BFC18_20280 [Alteromonas confluentis]